MIEHVYQPTRNRAGKRVVSRMFYGHYSLTQGGRMFTVSLGTPDRKVAEKRLRDLIVERQREAEGIIAPRAMRDAAASTLSSLVDAYAVDLRARTVPGHASESLARLRRVLLLAAWKRLQDVTPASWVACRSGLNRSAKTVKEYQTSVMAFLNWLVRMDMLAANPLAKVGAVKIKGKAVRKSRAFTQVEFSSLLSAAPGHRRLVYQFLGYTGARKNEARSLLWSDLDLGARPCVHLREENTKSAEERVVPLKAELAEEMRRFRLDCEAKGGPLPDAVFLRFPSDDALHGDLKRAGVDRKDASGRVVHFHAFRKTFQTWGAVAGIGQRSAQEMLGHSDPSLTADAYTDATALPLHAEVAKLPWFGVDLVNVPDDVQIKQESSDLGRFRLLLGELINLAQVVVLPVEGHKKTDSSESVKLAARHGFEP